VAEVARELDVSPSTIWRWRLQHAEDSGRVRRAAGRGDSYEHQVDPDLAEPSDFPDQTPVDPGGVTPSDSALEVPDADSAVQGGAEAVEFEDWPESVEAQVEEAAEEAGSEDPPAAVQAEDAKVAEPVEDEPEEAAADVDLEHGPESGKAEPADASDEADLWDWPELVEAETPAAADEADLWDWPEAVEAEPTPAAGDAELEDWPEPVEAEAQQEATDVELEDAPEPVEAEPAPAADEADVEDWPEPAEVHGEDQARPESARGPVAPEPVATGVDVEAETPSEDSARDESGDSGADPADAVVGTLVRRPFRPAQWVADHRPRAGRANGRRAGSEPGAEAAPPGPSQIDLTEVLAVLRRRIGVVLLGAAFGVVGAGVLALQEVSRYRATAVLRVGEARTAVTQGIETPAVESDRYVNPLLSQTQLLRSRSLIGEVVDSVGFRLVPDYGELAPGLLAAVTVVPNATVDTLWLEFDDDAFTVRSRRSEGRALYGESVQIDGVQFTMHGRPTAGEAIWSVTPRQAAVDRLLADLRVSPRNETNVVDVSYSHRDPAVAQRVTNTLVLAFQRFEAQFAQERSRQRRIFLEEQVAQTDSSLARAQSALRRFQTASQTFDARQELTAQQQNRMVLEIRREELDAERRMYQGLLDRLDTPGDEIRWEVLRTLFSAPGIAENAAVSRIHEQLLRQRAVLDSLTAGDFGNAGTNPDVQRQRELIAASESEMVSAIRSHVASLDARAVALEELSRRTAQELSSLPYQAAEAARLEQIVQTYQRVSDQLWEEYQKARMAEGATVGQADIIDLATLPYRPEPGRRIVIIALGLFLGLALGSGGAFVLEHRNTSVQSREELETTFQLPVLGVIPKAADPDLAELERQHPGVGVPAPGRGPAIRPQTAHAVEAYRMLRTNFMFAGWTGDVRSIVVTSTAPREGKTLTAANLAASIAEEGMRVLLVDADLWRGRIHEILAVPETPGFGEILAGQAAGHEAIRPTGVPGLDFLPRGERQRDPSSLARSAVMKAALQELGRDYDALVIDGPPVLAAGSAPVVAAVADGVLLLVRAGQTDRHALREALRQLETVGARVIGAVLNDPEDMDLSVGGRYYHQYEYASK
jgi:tyrosine-protein kinase Etk/Wzc